MFGLRVVALVSEASFDMTCRAALGYEVAHELAHDLGSRPIICLTGVDEGAPQLFVDPDLECNVLPRHAGSVPIVHPFGYPKLLIGVSIGRR